ncbi:MAG: TIGR00282 family metallophosphoesterase [Acutalibacteraceae bacterium]|jgi:metallophosphoesterase (TIGR00282 family)
MRLLCIGDVCGSSGCEMVRRTLPELKLSKKIDTVIINGENSADGNGITPKSAEYLFACGADVITGGNHSFRRSEMLEYYDRNRFVLRPHNLPDASNGSGYCLLDKGRYTVAVINLSGKIFLEKLNAQNPFLCADELVERAKSDGANVIVVDFHAEATSEKRALGLYLDGRVSVFYGTHTHVQTADNQVLPGGTGYITDIGMTGPKNSVLGVKSEIIINRLKSDDYSKFELSSNKSSLNACIFDVDTSCGKTISTERIIIGESK